MGLIRVIREIRGEIVSPKGDFRGIIGETKKIRVARKCRQALRYECEHTSVIYRIRRNSAMRQVITALLAMTCLLVIGWGQAQAQVPAASVKFTNKTDFNVVVRGFTIVNGQRRMGPPISIPKGGVAFDVNVPAGIRYYGVWEGTRFVVLLQNYQVPVQNRDLAFSILPNPTNPKQVVIVAD
jgi:hypothetical protein